jgi:hypothetical protein
MGAERAVIFCLVPEALAEELLEPLREHYSGRLEVTVIVDRRESERRADPGRLPPPLENSDGLERRSQERRRPVVPRRFAGELPPALAMNASSLRWAQRLGPVRRELSGADLEEVLNAVARGHDDALAELYWRYVNRVSVRLASRLDERRETEDATRDVFGRLFDELPRYRAEDGAFMAFVDSVVDAVVADRSVAAVGPPAALRNRRRSGQGFRRPAGSVGSDHARRP